MNRSMGDPEFARNTLEKFQDRAVRDVELIREGVSAGDVEGATRVAHNLKAVAAHVAAESLRKIAFEIEQAGRPAGTLSFIETQLGLLAEEAKRHWRRSCPRGDQADREHSAQQCRTRRVQSVRIRVKAMMQIVEKLPGAGVSRVGWVESSKPTSISLKEERVSKTQPTLPGQVPTGFQPRIG